MFYLTNLLIIVVIIIRLISVGLAEPFIDIPAVHPKITALAYRATLHIKRVPSRRIIKIAESIINLNTIYKSADIFKLVNLSVSTNNPIPVRIRPARNSLCKSYLPFESF